MVVSCIDLTLETTDGTVVRRVSDPGFLFYLLPPHDDDSSSCLRFVDPFGTTVFNYLQAPHLAVEVSGLIHTADTQEAHDFLVEVRVLAEECQRKRGLLWFRGD